MKSKTNKTMRVAVFAAAMIGIMMTRAAATEFWETFSNRFAYNYAVKSGSVYKQGMNSRLTTHEVLSVSSKSFSQGFGDRFREVAKSHRPLAVVCIFSMEPDRCYLGSVMKSMFGEIKLLPTPSFSEGFIKKFSKFYTVTLSDPKSALDKEIRAAGVPRHSMFNPRFGFTFENFEIIAAAPFYTYYGVYVEPQWGTSNGPSLGFLKKHVSLDFDRNGAAIRSIADVDLTAPCGLIVGNEARGVSAEWLTSAAPVSIPTVGVESLNAATAAAILLYEARRQRMSRP